MRTWSCENYLYREQLCASACNKAIHIESWVFNHNFSKRVIVTFFSRDVNSKFPVPFSLLINWRLPVVYSYNFSHKVKLIWKEKVAGRGNLCRWFSSTLNILCFEGRVFLKGILRETQCNLRSHYRVWLFVWVNRKKRMLYHSQTS